MANVDDAKIKIPQVFQKTLPRNHIAKILDDALLTEAVCMVAPYGCGKTFSVLSWLRERERKAAWLTLGETDKDETVFTGRLASTLLPFAREQNAADFLSDTGYREDPRAFLHNAASQIAAGNIAADTLVIDNFHFIHNDGLLRNIKDFIYLLLGRIRIIIISREQLPPVFNDLMLKNHICLISIKELSFSLEEMTEYLGMNGCPVSRQELVQIHKDTAGWPAAINVVLTISREGPVGYGEDARSYVKGFFEEEIWDSLGEDMKDFLLKTSILETLTPSSCHAVTDMGATLPTLKWLFQNGFFISRQEKKDAYRYHRVFRDFLLDKLSTSDIDEQELYKRAAWWYFEQADYEQSFPCFFRVRELYGINEVLRILNPASMGGIDRYLMLTHCITELDIELLKPYPVIIARIALTSWLTGDIEKMQSLQSILLEWSEPGALPVSPDDYEEFIWELGWLTHLNPNEPTKSKKQLDWINIQNRLPHIRRLSQDRIAVLCFPSIVRGVRDFGPDGYGFTEEVLRRVEGGEKNLIDLEESVWQTYLILAEFYYEVERFSEGEKIVRQIMAIVEEEKYTYLYLICVALLVKFIRASHNPKEIDAILSRLEMIILKNGDTFLLPNFHALKQRERLASGIPGFTEEFQKENEVYEDKPYFFLMYRHVTLVRGLLSTGDYNRAMVILGNLELLCKKYNRPTDLMEVNMLKSIALYRLGDEDSACGFFMEALDYGRKDGFIRIFSDDAKGIWPVLELVRKKKTDKYIETIAISCKKTLARRGIRLSEKYNELTKTELKILKALQSGMSYKEIALDNNIRLPTVKSHIHSIYSKLYVNNRISAVMAAQNMGILEPMQADQNKHGAIV